MLLTLPLWVVTLLLRMIVRIPMKNKHQKSGILQVRRPNPPRSQINCPDYPTHLKACSSLSLGNASGNTTAIQNGLKPCALPQDVLMPISFRTQEHDVLRGAAVSGATIVRDYTEVIQ